MPKLHIQRPASIEIRQHNALINSPFSLSTLEWRVFTALLERIHPQDQELKEHFISASELVGTVAGGGKAYHQIAELSEQLTERKLRLEQLGPGGERLKTPDFSLVPWLALAKYVKKRGGLTLVLNPLFVPYLLQLAERGNFTRSQVAELKHLKSNHAYKLYWLLAEYRAFGTRTFTLDGLYFRLGIAPGDYEGRFDNFRVKVLERAQRELASTDMAFGMEFLRESRQIRQVRFTFRARPLPLLAKAAGPAAEPTPPPPA